jgi:magnesium chelatase subunit D
MNPQQAASSWSQAQVWQDAQLALLALQLDPQGLGGIWLRAGHGPVRDAWLAGLQASGLHTVKIPAQVDDQRLLGGIDLAQTLQCGRLVQQPGLLAQADGGAVLLPMAERLSAQTVAQIAQAQDRGLVHSQDGQQTQAARFGVVALDESEADEAGLAARLTDRLGLWLDLRSNCLADSTDRLERLSPQERREALALLRQLAPTQEQVEALCETAAALGVDSLRAPLMALRLAAVHAALEGRATLDDEDLGAGARLVLGPRATRLPQAADSAPAEPAPQDASGPQPQESQNAQDPPDRNADDKTDTPQPAQAPAPDPERLLAAALASLPPHLLDRLLLGQSPSKTAKGLGSSGLATRSKLRGRPLTPRAGQPGAGARLHLLATLRAAAPKQRLRHKPPGAGRVSLRAEDFQVQRFAQRSPSCLIFALDASGSAAMQRLAEAKGAVELLLQDSYARRDSVCVIAFRAASAQVLLAPTRSLVRAKRALAGLPGGGGTPLASGLQAAMQQARALQRAGSTPMLVMLSDGRANVSAAGVGGRAQAQADALAWAGQWQSSGFAALWIDTAAQPEPQARTLAQRMGAHYFPMPYVQAQRMAAVVQNLSVQLR